jgi:hypothetical protein
MRFSISGRSLLNYAGVAILIAGMAVGEFVYWRSLQGARGGMDGSNDDSLLSPYNSRVYERDMQRYIGTFGLIIDQWTRSLARLEEPKPLAITIAAVSMLVAGGCFIVASRMPRS